jgi:hypothetical protein
MKKVRGTELKISNAEFRFLNEEVENILLLESHTCLPTAGRVLCTTFLILATSYLILFPNNLHFPNTTLYLLSK